MSLPDRKRLYHETPCWVSIGACFYVTICAVPRSRNQLATPLTSPAILDSVAEYHNRGTWWVHLFLLMPDHLHALLAVAPDRSLDRTIRAWKSWQAKISGVKWQTGFFEHRIRSDDSFAEKAEYIRQNPVRAGLVARAEDWPHLFQAPSR